MPNILWLDDQRGFIAGVVERVRSSGYEVSLAHSESEAIRLLEGGYGPDVLIQDLHRPRSRNLEVDWPTPVYEGDLDASAGWRFYESFLREQLPHLPVIIFSADAFQERNRRRADDFNLTLLQKTAGVSQLLNELERVLGAQRQLIDTGGTSPSIVVPDFERVNDALIRHLSKNPHLIHDVSWSSFEKLVARLLSELGYEVETTKLTRDGGVDLWALHRHDLGETLYAIDAKKYAPNRLVGPEPVRAIRGVASLQNATIGMIVTTSSFGPAALDLAQQYRFLLSLKDFNAVQEWIRKVAGSTSSAS